MPHRHDALFDRIANFQALVAAARRAVRGKRRSPGGAAFLANLETRCLTLERDLQAHRWRPGRYAVIRIEDPKPRRISAAPFRDRVVHHAFCHVVEPLFERGFIHDSYANRKGKGTHAGVERYERFRNGTAHVLRCDIWRYFPAIDHSILKRDLRRRLACSDTLWLADAIIDGSNPQEPVERYFPGDDLLAPVERRRGLPIGNLTSQFFANLYLDPLDHFVKEVLRCRRYLRYVDDFALFHDDPCRLAEWRSRIAEFLVGRRLILHPEKTRIASTNEPTAFLGYVLDPMGRRMPTENVARFRNRLRGLRDRWRAGTVTEEVVRAHVEAWIAHASFADTRALMEKIFRGGWFDPRREGLTGLKPAGWCAAVPGTTTHRTFAPPTATGTNPRTGTTISGSVPRARLNA